MPPLTAERVLVLAPIGRDALIAKGILREARIPAQICVDLGELVEEVRKGADAAVMTEETLHGADVRELMQWVATQATWSDFPFVVLTRHGGGIERNPAAARVTSMLGNVSFLERPFHPTTLVSVVQTALRSRWRQYECRRLGEELETRVEERTAELAAANRQLLTQMEEQEKVEATLRQMQRLEAVGQLTSGVAHDFNNLLTVVLGNIAFLEKGLEANADPKLLQRLGYMRAAAERGAKLTDQLLSFSRRQRLEPKPVEINSTVAAMRDLLKSTIGGRIRIKTNLGEKVWPAMVDSTQLELAVLNLAINARDAMEVGGSLTVSTANVTLGPPLNPEEPSAGDYVAITVADTGNGMVPEVRAKCFEPFFTTKDVGKGSGLGLSQVLGFAKQSGGGLRLDSRVGEGTSVHVFLPRALASGTAPAAAAPLVGLKEVCGTILLVDDDSAVREITGSILRDQGHTVLEAGSGAGALDLLQREAAIDLMLIDFAMPGMSGAELARRVQAKRPRLPVLFITGFADRAALSGVPEGCVIGKPFVGSELADKVHLALAGGVSGKVVRLRG